MNSSFYYWNKVQKKDTSDDKSTPVNKMAHMLKQADPECVEAFRKRLPEPKPNKIIKNLCRIFGEICKSSFKRIFYDKQYNLSDIMLVADVCQIQPSEVIARMFGEEGYKSTISSSQQANLQFHAMLTDSLRSDLRYGVYEDLSNFKKHAEIFELIPDMASFEVGDLKYIRTTIDGILAQKLQR